jgi:superfamily I DNA/RNA helicase
MMGADYKPTPEQLAIIQHPGHAFVRACPGAGKTRTMVERARFVLSDRDDRRSIAFLSFTNAAVDELTSRLMEFGVLSHAPFPNFVGTFDRFLWQFLIAPFGIAGCTSTPRLVPDKKDWIVKPPFPGAREITLECFNRETGALIQEKADEVHFEPKNGPGAWESVAKKIIAHSLAQGQLDFEDVRNCVKDRLKDSNFATRIGRALAGRFREIIVDEAQDCNPVDLKIIAWLRSAGVTIKIICDPNQGIYGFRGGVTDELEAFAGTFAEINHLPMSGNFRSSSYICAAINGLRPPASRGNPDQALGRHKEEPTCVHLISYSGASVPPAIGGKFRTLIQSLGIKTVDAPILASTWSSASNAAGRRIEDAGNDKTLNFAQSVMSFLSAFEAGNRRDSLARLHRAVLLIRGQITSPGDYGRYISQPEQEDGAWRSEIIAIGQSLALKTGETSDDWLNRARSVLNRDLIGATTINQRLKNHAKLGSVLASGQPTELVARSIHDVKGLEFPAVCVVFTVRTAGKILAVLTGANTEPKAIEDARKMYVGASRAERLLAIAVPKSKVAAFETLLNGGGLPVTLLEV